MTVTNHVVLQGDNVAREHWGILHWWWTVDPPFRGPQCHLEGLDDVDPITNI